jgi:hypothetical protein
MPFITVSRTETKNAGFLEFARAATLQWSITGTKPNTRMWAFYDGVKVDQYVTPTGGSLAGTVTTDANGAASGTFALPGGVFGTGKKTFRFQDSPIFAGSTGATVGSAEAVYETVGTLNTSQVVNSTIYVPPVDPIAQSFFTYGVTGGLFVTKIDLYFGTKDASAPITLELRKLSNGFPTETLVAPDARVIKTAADVVTSLDSSLPTTFTFDSPIYLPENGDYCFVLISNCNTYNVWTSRLGEKAVEDSKIIYEQPYIGSLFKSENNKTWTPDQYEDIKFTIYKATFNTSATSDLVFSGTSPSFIMSGTGFSTVSGSSTITVTTPFPHGLTVSSKFKCVAQEVLVSSVDTCSYNGLTGANLSGSFTVASVIDKYNFTFAAGANATSTGTITRGGIVNRVIVTAGGTGYTSAPNVVFSGGGGTGAAGTAVLDANGSVSSVTMTNKGTGYTSAPSVSFTSGGGSGALALSDIAAFFTVTPNIAYDAINIQTNPFVPSGTKLTSTLKPTNASYDGGSVSSYTAAEVIPVALGKMNELKVHSLVASRENEIARMAGATSNELRIGLSSTNPNVSPVIDLNTVLTARVLSNLVSNQVNETISSTSKTASIATITVPTGSGGSGYTSAPTVLINGTAGLNGVVATAVITSGAVSSVTLTNGGSGFTAIPTITFSGGGGTGATATATVTTFNTELGSTGGTSESKYITKKITLARPSVGVRTIATMYSSVNTSVDVYIRTSLTSELTNHDAKDYVLLNCDVARNLSASKTDMREYTYYLDKMTPFDVFNLKFVLRTSNPVDAPIITDHRTIILAT